MKENSSESELAKILTDMLQERNYLIDIVFHVEHFIKTKDRMSHSYLDLVRAFNRWKEFQNEGRK